MAHVAVIGSGITGVTTAYALRERGHAVTMIERHVSPGMETSFANGGQLSVSNAEVWNSWRTILKGLRWMLRADAPLLLNPRPGWHKYSWLGEFTAQIGRYRENTIETVRLALAARARLLEIADREHIDFDLERRGILHIYHDAASLADAARGNALLVEAGLERFAVTTAEMLAIEPALAGSPDAHLAGGYFTPSDATGDIHKYTRGLADACVRDGARLLSDTEVERIAVDGAGATLRLRRDGAEQTLRAEAVAVCAGVASRRFAAMLGDRINVYPVKGYSITVALDDESSRSAAPTVSLLDESAKVVSSRLGRDRLRIAGTAEFNGFNRDIRPDRIAPLVRWCERLFPGVNTGAPVPWAGLRPMTPSMLPRVGRGRRDRVFYNTGHGHLGWTLAAATADLVADAIDARFA